MSTLRKIAMSTLSVIALSSSPAFAQSTTVLPSTNYVLVGAVFDDGGTAIGGFAKYPEIASSPLPEFYNIQMMTTVGTKLSGSTFASFIVCYINTKQLACTPNDNFLVSLDTGVPGQSGYDHFQIAAYFAPNALVGQIGTLDPTFSYEIACTGTGCLTRHITGGAIRFGQ